MGRIIHPALHFDPAGDLATVGVVTTKLQHTIVGVHRRPDGTWEPFRGSSHAAAIVGVEFEYCPAPYPYPKLADRWDSRDLEAFIVSPEAPAFEDVLRLVRQLILDHVELPQPAIASFKACWTVGTYFYPIFEAYPRVNITGQKGSGKSKSLKIVSRLAFNGRYYLNTTAPALFRLIEPIRPTLCLDEMENLRGANVNGIVDILNAGYKSGGTIPRVEGEADKRHVVEYDVYAPMAVASINGLNAVTADRAITITMLCGTDPAKVNSVVPEHVFGPLRAQCYRLALMRHDEVRNSSPALPAWLKGRHRELYGPLLRVANLAKGSVGDTLRADIESLAFAEVKRGDRGPTDEGWALYDALTTALRAGEQVTVYPGKLVGPMRVYLGQPPEPRFPNDGLMAESVGRLLRSHGFEPDKRKREGVPYTITRAAFSEMARRHGYPEPDFTAPAPLDDATVLDAVGSVGD
jgi:hypothetical protein